MKKLLIASAAAFFLLSAFNTIKKNKPKLPEEFVIIPGGTISLNGDASRNNDDNPANKISIESFYFSKYEVTNLQYRQFYTEVSPGLTDAEKKKISCDSLGWRETLTYNKPMLEFYYRHPAYNNYPVVNIQYEGVAKYCAWLQSKLQTENPGYRIEVSLPSKTQWMYAAMGGQNQAMYPWRNFYLRNKKGEFLCNFKSLGDQAIVRNRTTGTPEVKIFRGGDPLPLTSFFTAQVKSFYPNGFGLYNMCGNAAEMVKEKAVAMGGSWNDYGGDVQIRSEAAYEKSSPTIGFRPLIIATPKSEN